MEGGGRTEIGLKSFSELGLFLNMFLNFFFLSLSI